MGRSEDLRVNVLTVFTVPDHFIQQLSFLIPHTKVLTTREENVVLFQLDKALCQRWKLNKSTYASIEHNDDNDKSDDDQVLYSTEWT